MRKLLICSSLFAAPLSASYFGSADLLYWKAEETKLTYAVDDDGNGKRLDFDYEPGWRAMIGYKNPCYMLSLTGLNFHSKTRDSATGDLISLWTIDKADATEARAFWRLHLGLFDLDLASCYRAFCLTVRPYVGLRTAIIRRKFQPKSLIEEQRDRISTKNKFFGIGPRAGCKINWGFGLGLSLFGDASASYLYGNFYVHQIETRDGEKLFSHNESSWEKTPTYDFATGLEWKIFCLTLAAQVEYHYFPNQNRLRRPPSTRHLDGDLTIQGASVGLKLCY